jgi:hypothetical protein
VGVIEDTDVGQHLVLPIQGPGGPRPGPWGGRPRSTPRSTTATCSIGTSVARDLLPETRFRQ